MLCFTVPVLVLIAPFGIAANACTKNDDGSCAQAEVNQTSVAANSLVQRKNMIVEETYTDLDDDMSGAKKQASMRETNI